MANVSYRLSADLSSAPEIKKVNRHLKFPKAALTEPKTSGFIHLAAEIDHILPFHMGPTSQNKRAALARALNLTESLEKDDSVVQAKVFEAGFIPPGQGGRLRDRPEVHSARFDVSVIIETVDMEFALGLEGNDHYQELIAELDARSTYLHVVRAINGRSMGEVDTSRQDVFLFNYFFAEDADVLLAVWEYTAGWFQAKTGLDNSTLLVPLKADDSQYGIINYARWDHYWDVLPDLRLRPTFHSYVLAHFDANGIVPMPILYRLASPTRRQIH